MAETRSVLPKGAERRNATPEDLRRAVVTVSANASPTTPWPSGSVSRDASEKMMGQNIFQAPGRTIYSEREKRQTTAGLSLSELFQKDIDIKFERWLNLEEGEYVMEALEEVLRRMMEEVSDKGSPSPPGINSGLQQQDRGIWATSIGDMLLDDCDDTNWY